MNNFSWLAASTDEDDNAKCLELVWGGRTAGADGCFSQKGHQPHWRKKRGLEEESDKRWEYRHYADDVVYSQITATDQIRVGAGLE